MSVRANKEILILLFAIVFLSVLFSGCRATGTQPAKAAEVPSAQQEQQTVAKPAVRPPTNAEKPISPESIPQPKSADKIVEPTTSRRKATDDEIKNVIAR